MKTQALRLIIASFFTLFILFAPAHAAKRVALSFDDIPRSPGAFLSQEQRAQKIIDALKKTGVKQAVFFLNPGNLDEPERAGGEGRIDAYVAAGHVIANHSANHPHLSKVTAEEYLADIDAAESWLKGRKGYRPWFRFPYLAEGGRDKEKRDAVRAGLKARGLTNGYVTADGYDWYLEALTIEAKAANKSMDMERLKQLYIATQMNGLEYHDQLARDTTGRSPAHMLLLHETDLAALFLPDLIAEMKKRGWTIITADQAYKDPIAKVMPDVPFAAGTLIGSMAWQKDIKPAPHPVWMGEEMISLLFKRRVLKETEQQ
jgi:peptidoglycan-N-acetylglucosamine deacetylase